MPTIEIAGEPVTVTEDELKALDGWNIIKPLLLMADTKIASDEFLRKIESLRKKGIIQNTDEGNHRVLVKPVPNREESSLIEEALGFVIKYEKINKTKWESIIRDMKILSDGTTTKLCEFIENSLGMLSDNMAFIDQFLEPYA